MNKIEIIENTKPEVLVHQVNKFGETHNVFATQTHVTVMGQSRTYTAVIFYKVE